MRGAHHGPPADLNRIRIIPADAGSTAPAAGIGAGRWDHPRRCGEHGDVTLMESNQRGSSPQMRGAHNIIPIVVQNVRIIPADAGSTARLIPYHLIVKDHPRRCGEHCMTTSLRLNGSGSSPQMRGAPDGERNPAEIRGIIPADAGSTHVP